VKEKSENKIPSPISLSLYTFDEKRIGEEKRSEKTKKGTNEEKRKPI